MSFRGSLHKDSVVGFLSGYGARGGGEGLCNQPGLNTIWSLTTRSDSAESILCAEYNKLFFGCIKYFPLVRSIRRIENSNLTV